MASTDLHQDTIVRTERGLVIAGTRITLYAVFDYLKADWPPELIKHWLNLTDDQIADALDYIQVHQAEVEKEYELIQREAENSRRFWQEHNRERFAAAAAQPPKPDEEAIRAKLRERKTQLGME